MAHSLSAKKRIRQSAKRQLRNKRRKAEIKNVVRDLETKISAGDIEGAKSTLSAVYKTMDKVAAKGTIHKKTAARRKARLAKAVNKIGAK